MKPTWKVTKLVASIVMLALIAWMVWRYIDTNWDLLSKYEWNLRWPWIFLATSFMFSSFIGLAIGWRTAVSLLGQDIHWRTGLILWSKSSLTRYLPVSVWVAASRIYLTTRLGIPWKISAIGFGLELLGSTSGAFAVAILALPMWTDISAILYVPVFVLVILILLPATYIVGFKFLRRTKIQPSHVNTKLVIWSTQYAITFLLFGLANYFVLQALVIESPPIEALIGISSLAWAVGTLNVLNPGGLGTREIVLTMGLNSYLSAPELFALGVMSRLTSVFGELLLFAVLHLLGRVQSKRPATNLHVDKDTKFRPQASA